MPRCTHQSLYVVVLLARRVVVLLVSQTRPRTRESQGEQSTLDAYGECVEGTRPRRARSTPTRPHLTPRTHAYPFHVLAHIALPTRMEPTAPHAETPVAHNPQHSASHTPATPLEKGKSRMVLDSPDSVTTMAADLRDLSRAKPPPHLHSLC